MSIPYHHMPKRLTEADVDTKIAYLDFGSFPVLRRSSGKLARC